ncbi:hypothetical protein [Streptomyces sp. enrichment culture]
MAYRNGSLTSGRSQASHIAAVVFAYFVPDCRVEMCFTPDSHGGL